MSQAKAIVGIGRVLLWSGGSLWIGRATGHAQPHAHHAIQISLALTGRLRLCGDAGQGWREHVAAMVSPHQRHQFDGAGETVAQVFVEPETAQGRALLAQYGTAAIADLPVLSVQADAAALCEAFNAGAPDEGLIAIAQRLVAGLCGHAPALSVDPRVSRAIALPGLAGERRPTRASVRLTMPMKVAP